MLNYERFLEHNDRVAGVAAGHDLEMPSSCCINDRKLEEAVSAGTLSVAALDDVVSCRVSSGLQEAAADLSVPQKFREAVCAARCADLT